MAKPAKGFLLIDKAASISSFAVIYQLRKITGIKRIGHFGTLDPFATGLLICALGSYTRLNSLLEGMPKSYQAEVLLGQSTNTGDPEGEVIEERAVDTGKARPDAIKAAALKLTQLATPAFSAVWVNGKRAYELARSGRAVDLPPRPTHIYDFEITRWPDAEPVLGYHCSVSKGTYIRSLSQWIAAQFDTVGYTQSLRRTAIGSFDVEQAVKLEELNADNWDEYLVPPQCFFAQSDSRVFCDELLSRLRNGQSVADDGEDSQQVIVYDSQNELVCVAARSQARLFPKMNLA